MNETTIKHKFKIGDELRYKNGISGYTVKVCLIHVTIGKNGKINEMLYLIKNGNYSQWVEESLMEIATEKELMK